MTEDEIEILEPKEYTPRKDEAYSHPSLVMSALRKAIENRAKEMRDGYWNTKFDKFGNAHKIWIPDSRQEFIESVESLMMVEERDFDEPIITAIKKIKEDLTKKFKEYCEKEKKEWEGLNYKIKGKLNSEGYYFREEMLSERLPYKFEYIRDKVKFYSEIVSLIQQLIKRIGDYQEEIYEA